MTELTDEQRELVEANHNLIYYVAKYCAVDVTEYYDVLALSLCKASCKFNPDRGVKFSTFAVNVMKNDLWGEKRKEARKYKNQQKYSEELEEQSEVYMEDILDLRNFSDLEKKVIKLKMDGWYQAEIAEKCNINRYEVGKVLNRIKIKLREEYND